MKKLLVRGATLACLAFAPMALAQPVFDPGRPAADVQRDADRKPAAMLAFASVKPGQTIVDLIPGGGYFTRLFSAAVGPTGRVYAVVPDALAKRSPPALAAAQAVAAEPGRGNVTVIVEPLAVIRPAGTVDLVWTSQNYHDLHNPALPTDTLTGVNKAIFAALKPGGLYVVEDHVAEADSGVRDAGTLHRIDPATVKAEVLSAGFVFDGQSDALVNPADDHTKKVFDPAIRGHTDQFVYRFKKPG